MSGSQFLSQWRETREQTTERELWETGELSLRTDREIKEYITELIRVAIESTYVNTLTRLLNYQISLNSILPVI